MQPQKRPRVLLLLRVSLNQILIYPKKDCIFTTGYKKKKKKNCLAPHKSKDVMDEKYVFIQINMYKDVGFIFSSYNSDTDFNF